MKKTLFLILTVIFLNSCKTFRMDPPFFTEIKLFNNSNVKIQPVINWSIEDTLTTNFMISYSVEAGKNNYLIWVEDWEKKTGIILKIYDSEDFWEEEYLSINDSLSSEDVLAKYILPMNVLRDSMNYEIYYPDSTRVYKSNF